MKPLDQLTYDECAHAIQTGIAVSINCGSQSATPKHLRTGLDTTKAEHAGLVQLLIDKGLFSQAEYEKAMLAAMRNEVAFQEKLLSQQFGKTITLR